MDRIGFWNIKGMNKVIKETEINYILHNNEVGFFALLETKIKNKALLRATSSFSNWCISTNNGYHNVGRIWILWNLRLYRIHSWSIMHTIST
ncbi:hypothetical protein vseg_010593 [Gypsophila vaccaria]